jgi:uncharacterized protein YuzE
MISLSEFLEKMKKTRIHYDKKYDILYFVLKSGPADYAEEIDPFITVEYDKNDKPIGIEIFKASQVLGEKLIKQAPLRPSPVAA